MFKTAFLSLLPLAALVIASIAAPVTAHADAPVQKRKAMERVASGINNILEPAISGIGG